MESINRERARDRIAMVNDIATAAQSTLRGIKQHIRDLRKAAGDAPKLGINDFMKDIGKRGI